MADELRLKVSQAEYVRRIGVLDTKIGAINTLLGEYQDLQRDATKVFGDGDSNLAKLRESVNSNIKAVMGQQEELKESRAMLEKQMQQLGILSQNVDTMFNEGAQTAKTLFNTVKIVGDLVN